jgi:hypothetical protein
VVKVLVVRHHQTEHMSEHTKSISTGGFIQNLTVNQLLKKFPVLCGTNSFLTLLTRAFC